MFQKNKRAIALLGLLLTIFFACKKDWNEHNQITDGAVANNLLVAIQKDTSLSVFASLMVKSGYDKIVASAKTFTVWAPNNAALKGLDTAVVNDTAKLKLFVGNHIAIQSYLVGTDTAQRIKMLNNKYNYFGNSKFDSANIIKPNKYANNGIYHVIDKYIPVLPNCWTLLNTIKPSANQHISFLNSLNFILKDTAGNPIYNPDSSITTYNRFLNTVVNIADESKQFTFFVLTDDAYTFELDSITPFFADSVSATKNDVTAKLFLIKDFAIAKAYSAANLPDTVVSTFGIKVPVNKSSIVASYKTSNGYVHVVNNLHIPLPIKFPPIIVQGEKPSGFSDNKVANTFYRARANPNSGAQFNDIMVQNTGVSNFYIRYFIKELYSTTYNVSWVAVNDVQATGWTQRLAMGSAISTDFPYLTVARNVYDEIPLGSYFQNSYGTLSVYLVGPTKASTTSGAQLSLDYFKLTPVLYP